LQKSASLGDITGIGKTTDDDSSDNVAGNKDKPVFSPNARDGYSYRDSISNINESIHESNLSLPRKRDANGLRRNTIAIPKYKHNYSHVKSSVNSGNIILTLF